MLGRSLTESLVCKLTAQETLEYGQEQSRLLVEMEELTAEVADLNASKKSKKERVDKLAKAIDSGEEERLVECRWDYDWAEGTKALTRMDTSECIKSVPIEAHERQGNLTVV